MASRFEHHLEMFPHDAEAAKEFIRVVHKTSRDRLNGVLRDHGFDNQIERILFLTREPRLVEQIDVGRSLVEEEGSFFDTAASVERLTKQRALDRLLNLCQEDQAS